MLHRSFDLSEVLTLQLLDDPTVRSIGPSSSDAERDFTQINVTSTVTKGEPGGFSGNQIHSSRCRSIHCESGRPAHLPRSQTAAPDDAN